MSERRIWFHCSTTWRGLRWVAERTTPRFAGANEPPVPRLCVASSVARCFAARIFDGDVLVYRTESPRRTVTPRGVWDSLITGERWIIPPAPMILDSVIPAGVVDAALGPTRERVERKLADLQIESIDDIVAKRAGMTPAERIQGFREIVAALGPEYVESRDVRFLERIAQAFPMTV